MPEVCLPRLWPSDSPCWLVLWGGHRRRRNHRRGGGLRPHAGRRIFRIYSPAHPLPADDVSTAGATSASSGWASPSGPWPASFAGYRQPGSRDRLRATRNLVSGIEWAVAGRLDGRAGRGRSRYRLQRSGAGHGARSLHDYRLPRCAHRHQRRYQRRRLISGCVAACIVSWVSATCGLVDWRWTPVIAFAGIGGMFLDSVLGATWEIAAK